MPSTDLTDEDDNEQEKPETSSDNFNYFLLMMGAIYNG